MDGTVFTALVSGVVALATVTVTQALTYFFSKKHDHEADWRKKKLEHYIEYVAAFSGAARKGSDATAKLRYADAASSLALVAPPSVLIALKTFQDGIDSEDFKHDLRKWGPVWSSLLRAMRKDCHPKNPNDNPDFIFGIADGPPDGQTTKKN
jgi:hypothetical protein